MKKLLYSITTLFVLISCAVPASAKLEIVDSVVASYGARSIIREVPGYIFRARPALRYYLQKYNIPNKFSASESDAAIAADIKFDASADSSVMYFTLSANKDETFLIYNDVCKTFTREYFYPIFNKEIGGVSFWLKSKIIDKTHILLYLNTLNGMSTPFNGLTNGSVAIFDATKDTVTCIPKVYFPDYEDSTYAYCGTIPKWTSYETDYSARQKSNKVLTILYDYEYSKALQSNDSAKIASTPANQVIAVYNPETYSFKVIAPFDVVQRNIHGQSSTYEPIYGELPNGFYWVSTYYDDFYKRNYDTLNVYNFDADSLSMYDLSGAFSRYRLPIVASFESNDGGIIFHNVKNDIVKWNSDGTFSENLLISSVYFDSTTTIPALCGDKAGNIYCIFNQFHSLLRLSPDGELIEINAGPESNLPSLHIYSYLTSEEQSNDAGLLCFEDEDSKFMFFYYQTNEILGNNIRLSRKMVLDLNYGSSGVGNEPANSYLQLEKIYPNPASGIINFFVSANAGLTPRITSFKIIDESGAEVADLTSRLSLQGGQQIVSFDVSRLAAGTYIATVGNDICKSSRKFIVK